MEALPPRAKPRSSSRLLLLRTIKAQNVPHWVYELKLDGYRAIAFKSGGRVYLRSRNNRDFAARYPSIAAALSPLPDQTVIDGEIVALDEHGRPSFNALQNYGSSTAPLFYYLFDLMILSRKDVMGDTLERRRTS
jgi:bifunctional non-homologous end joining protein LigD